MPSGIYLRTLEAKANNSAAQRKRFSNPAEREKIAITQKKRLEDPAERKKISGENHYLYGKTGENHPFYGKPPSVETIEKMKTSAKRRFENPEERAKCGCPGENHPLYGKQHSLETVAKMSVAKSGENHPLWGKHHSVETIAKMSGENSPAYRDGSCCNGSSPNYHANFTFNFRELIRDRDNHRCQLCYKLEEQNGRFLSIHHIFYDEETNDCSNFDDFVSLCNECHGKTNYNREFWVSFFLNELYFSLI